MQTPRLVKEIRRQMDLPRLAVDFDGVICGPDHDPVEGCLLALRELAKRHEMVVFTARHDLDWVYRWLVANHVSHYFVDVVNRKPRADVYLDDRGMKFTSWNQAMEDLKASS